MTIDKRLLAATALILSLAACTSTRNVDIDTLCPPRPETAAAFRPGTYPQAARPYREAALMAYRYMMGLPDMTCLAETGEPYNLYQHNAYVSKTHAAHIVAMTGLAEREPSLAAQAMGLAKASAEYLLRELEPEDAPLAFWPPTYIREPLAYNPGTDGPGNRFAMIGNEPEAAVKYRGEVMLLYPADVGSAFVAYYNATGEEKFLEAAEAIAGTYIKIRREDGCWPLKLELATGKEIEGNTLVPTRILLLFKALADTTGERRWRELENETFRWIAAHPLKDWNWDGQFEDISPEEAYKNPTKHNAIDVMLYMMERFPNNPKWMATCRDIMDFCEKRFVMWETPENHPDWPAPAVLEQYSCFTPIDASAAKMISAYLAMYRRFGNETDLLKARTLADSITRVQKESGRIPTFWEGTWDNSGVVSDQRYDWLNCMESAASALFAVADAVSDGKPEAVDLGLSVKWAPFNVGATSAEGFGNLYSWGRTVPADGKAYKKNYRHSPKEHILKAGHDVAATEWGGSWRVPTAGEFRELIEKCEWTWTLGEPNGFVVRGPNGNTIFLPAAGYQLEDILAIRGTGGFYWTSTADDEDPERAVLFQYRRLYGTDGPGLCKGMRYEGYSVRPVLDDSPEGWAPDLYWSEGYCGPKGFQTGFNADGKARMMLAGKPFYGFGSNCFDLFTGCLDGGFIPERMEKAVEVLADQEIPVVRLSLSPFYPFWMHYYTETTKEYFDLLEHLFTLCDEKHILLIPTLFWNFECFNQYCGEPLSAWGDPSSRTYAFMLKYTEEIMTRFAGHKCIAAWEFSNEFNLRVDLGHEGNPMISAAELGTACKGFADCVRRYDPTGRMIMSGHGLTRNAQYHLYTGPTWDIDSFDESVRILGILTPSPMEGLSEHYYEDKRIYSDLGEMDIVQRTAASKASAEALDKIFYVGEFTGPGCGANAMKSMPAHMKAFYDNGIQLSLVWNFSLSGIIEYSFTAETEEGLDTFEKIREYNRKFRSFKEKSPHL